MEPFQHLLLTRFNVPDPAYTADKRGARVRTPEWLDHRFRLFETYCFPSVRHQSCARFLWMVFFGADTPKPYHCRIEGYRHFPNFLPVFASNSQDLCEIINAHLSRDVDALITTRIDNDDAFHKDAIRTVQDQYHGQSFEFINLKSGYILSRGAVYRTLMPSNPFASLIERRTNQPFRTVWCDKHDRLRRAGPVTDLADQPLWLQVVHERNLTNDWGDRRSHALQPIKNAVKRTLLRMNLLTEREGWIEKTTLSIADLAQPFSLCL